MVVGVVAIGLWELWRGRDGARVRLRAALPLAAPCAVYVAWVAVLRVRLGVWPVGSSETRLTLSGIGLLDTVQRAPSAGVVLGVLAAVALCAAACVVARRDPLTWIAGGFLLFATTFSREVWVHAGFTRTLIPLFAGAAIAVLGARRGRRRDDQPVEPQREPVAVGSTR
jgi:hypothetical protein